MNSLSLSPSHDPAELTFRHLHWSRQKNAVLAELPVSFVYSSSSPQSSCPHGNTAATKPRRGGSLQPLLHMLAQRDITVMTLPSTQKIWKCNFYPLWVFVWRVKYVTYSWSDKLINRALSSDGRMDYIGFQITFILELYRTQFLLKKYLIMTSKSCNIL